MNSFYTQQNYHINVQMHQLNNQSDQEENIDLGESSVMNSDQQARFLNISRSKSADSFIGRLLPNLNQIPDRDRPLVFEPPSLGITNNIILSHPQGLTNDHDRRQDQPNGLCVFRKIKKEKVRSKCDYDKNICGYITKKVIREFVGKNYEQEVMDLTKKYRCSYAECKSYYLKKVEYVTGPSHLPELFNPLPDQVTTLVSCKRAFREFYRWFLKERYLRYLLLQGKMTNKLAYIEYKNNHLFKFVDYKDQNGNEYQGEMNELQMHMRTRSRSGMKVDNQDDY